jgi:hypothetical protein
VAAGKRVQAGYQGRVPTQPRAQALADPGDHPGLNS